MITHGCSIDGNLNDSKFSAPMPWIGIYVTAASLSCCFAMAADVIQGFRHRKYWFPCNYFSFNATSLTLIAVAIKLSVDLNTSMPRREDQLAKLSSTVLICTVMSHSMPSLGAMEDTEIFMNIMALWILVITVIANISIQLGTGVIYIFWIEHVFIMFLMIVLLLILSFSALTVPTTKRILEYMYRKKHELAVHECLAETTRSVVEKLKEDLTKYWMMAHTSSPQFVMGRLVTCTASGAFCLLSAMILAEAIIRSYLMPRSFKFCSGESDYKWSTNLVLIIQTTSVGVGTITPAFRYLTAINYRCPKGGSQSCKNRYKLESYWTRRLVEMKECPLVSQKISHRHIRKLVHKTKNQLLDCCIRMQIGIVLLSKGVQLISIFFVSQFFFCIDYCKKLRRKSGSDSQPSLKLDLIRFVLHLEGEEELVKVMMMSTCNATDHWIQNGKKKQPKYLIQLLEKSMPLQGFKGIEEFDNNQVPSLDSEEPLNCWALPVVTLTSIALALPNIEKCSIEQLLHGVYEGLNYVNFVENHLDAKGVLTNIRKAADVVWLGVDIYHKWLDVDLRKMSFQVESPKETLEELSDIAKNRFIEFRKRKRGCLQENPSNWPIKVLAANSLYRLSQTLLLDCKSKNNWASERIFEELSAMISGILAACFTNLQHVIPMECFCTTIEEREARVRRAVFLLGETERILKLLDRFALRCLGPDQTASIDKWRSLKQQGSLDFNSSSSDGGRNLFSSSDLYLSIE